MKALEFVACSTKLYEKQTEPICHEYGLTAMELNVLLFLANNPEKLTRIMPGSLWGASLQRIPLRLSDKSLLLQDNLYRNGSNDDIDPAIFSSSDAVSPATL